MNVAAYTARMNVTYSALITVDADSEDEAREKLKNGEWSFERQDEPTDWDDPTEIIRDD